MVTEKQFNDVLRKYPQKKWIAFAFKYLSKEGKDLRLKKFIVFSLLGVLLVGLFATMFNFDETIILLATLLYTGVMFIFVIFLFCAVIINNLRLTKIKKEFGISAEGYSELIRKYSC